MSGRQIDDLRLRAANYEAVGVRLGEDILNDHLVGTKTLADPVLRDGFRRARA